MPLPVIEYAEAVASNVRRHLLIGNGFSVSLNPSLFNFKNLFDRAGFDPDFIDFLQEDRASSERLGTYPDFEGTLRVLRDTSLVLKHMKYKSPDKLEELQETIKKGLTTAVHAVHEVKNTSGAFEKYITQFSKQEVLNCARFLKAFQHDGSVIFTLNYDLLLYRALMEIKSPNSSLMGLDNELRTEGITTLCRWGDAFIKERDSTKLPRWESWSTPNPRICFLHGALHLFAWKDTVIKITASADNLITRIQRLLSRGIMPLIVCEGTANRKRAKIFENDYLRACYTKLSGVDGEMLILGCSLAENDNHIWEAIDTNSRITSVLIGYFGNTEKALMEAAIERRFPNKVRATQIKLFDSSILRIWS